MFQITNHKEQALSTPIPYLLKFPEFYKLTEQIGDRNQIIEDIAWQLLYNLDYNTATGVWLDYIGKKVGQTRIYSPKLEGAFTFGGTTDEGFGAGRFKSALAFSSSQSVREDNSFRNAIKAKILINSTDASVDEVIQALKFLYNAKLVNLTESYPAGIDRIDLYGSRMIQDLQIAQVIKSIITAGVSVNSIHYHIFFNLFRNDAFITYNNTLPSNDDFEISLIVKPDFLSDTENTAILSQGLNWEDEFAPIRLYYDVENEEGVVFRTQPNVYNDNISRATYYVDGEDTAYYDSRAGIYLSGGNLYPDEDNTIKITRVGNTWSLYVNGTLVDTLVSSYNIPDIDGSRIYLGASNSKYYNSGSLYNLFIQNNTTQEIIINDPLQVDTIGINNGVIWI